MHTVCSWESESAAGTEMRRLHTSEWNVYLYIEQMVRSNVNTPVLSSTLFLQKDVAFVCLPAAGSGASTFFILWHMGNGRQMW